MKRITSLSLALVMLICTAFMSATSTFASINVDEATAVELNTKTTIQTTYDDSVDYQCSHSWVKFTATADGAYSFGIKDPGDEILTGVTLYPSKKDVADGNSTYPDGMTYSDESFCTVYNLAGGKTYYIDVIATDFENEKNAPALELLITKHTHNLNSFSYPADDYWDGSYGKECTDCGYQANVVEIPRIDKIKLSKTYYDYNGKAKKPTVSVKDRTGKTLKINKDYTVSYPKGRIKPGVYDVTIKFKGRYEGTYKRSFTIRPIGTSIKSVSPIKKGFVVKWKKNSDAKGYQIQCSRYSDFTNPKSFTISSKSTTSLKVENLLGKKKYYVRVRTYRIFNGKKVYSKWSKAETVTTKSISVLFP